MIHVVDHRRSDVVLAAILGLVLLTILILTIVAGWHGISSGAAPIWHAIVDGLADAGRRTLSF